MITPDGEPNDSALSASFRSKDIENSLVARPRKDASGDLAAPEKFGKMGQSAKIRRVAQLKAPVGELG